MLARALAWLVRPWLGGGSLRARALRIYAAAAALAALIVPAMVLHRGADGWWWHLTGSVLFCAPLGVLLVDWLADRADPAGRLFRGLPRLAVLFVGVALGIFLGYAVSLLLPAGPRLEVGVLLRDYRRSVVIVGAVVAVLAVAGTSLWYRAEAFRLQSEIATANFHALKRQMEPHFLFNALNSLKELIADDPETAITVTQQLADLYRLVLHATEHATLPLGEELTIVERYLAVERVRYGERLRFQIEVPEELRAVQVPSLLLQTLVENAVKHGVCKHREGGDIRIAAARAAADHVRLEVANSGAPFAPAPPGAAGGPTGLANTRARLDLLYGAAHRFAIGTDAAGRTSVSFLVPEAGR